MTHSIDFSNSYADLGENFFARINPEPVARPEMIRFNSTLATDLGLDTAALDSPMGAAIFAGNRIPEGAEPLAMAYAGHQFGGFNPQLGDGRALLLGEVVTPTGNRFDLHLKGSGPTPFSRNGDGRAALGPVLREYLLSEAMDRLGVPTTRALAAVATGEEVMRDRILPGAVITRIARGFVRVGTFEYFSAANQQASVRTLADYVIERNYPEAKASDHPYRILLERVIDAQAALIAKWMQLGFIHGVMNTDNMSISGETIDYGPCAFMDAFNHHQVYSSIDRQGRYAYANQPAIAQWNLIRFAETLLPLLMIDGDADGAVATAEQALNTFMARYQSYWLSGMRKKLGLATQQKNDKALVDELLDTMAEGEADFTLTFRTLSSLNSAPSSNDEAFKALFSRPEIIAAWLEKWRSRLQPETASDAERQSRMQAVNPAYIPRNHQVEAAIRAAEDHGDFSVFHQLHEVLHNPYSEQQGKAHYGLPPTKEEVVWQTFCGT